MKTKNLLAYSAYVGGAKARASINRAGALAAGSDE